MNTNVQQDGISYRRKGKGTEEVPKGTDFFSACRTLLVPALWVVVVEALAAARDFTVESVSLLPIYAEKQLNTLASLCC